MLSPTLLLFAASLISVAPENQVSPYTARNCIFDLEYGPVIRHDPPGTKYLVVTSTIVRIPDGSEQELLGLEDATLEGACEAAAMHVREDMPVQGLQIVFSRAIIVSDSMIKDAYRIHAHR